MAYVSSPVYGSASRKQAMLLKRQVKVYQGWYLTLCYYFLFVAYTAAHYSTHAILTLSVNRSLIDSPIPVITYWVCDSLLYASHIFIHLLHEPHAIVIISISYGFIIALLYSIGVTTVTNFKEWIQKLWYMYQIISTAIHP